MCGIMMYVKKKQEGSIRYDYRSSVGSVIKQLLYASAVRGWDSTGIIYGNNTGPANSMKSPVQPAIFLTHTKVKDLLKLYDFDYFIGHARWATQGSINYHNSHPFVFGHVSLVHNGTLKIMPTNKQNKTFEVDSEAIAYMISELEPESDELLKAISELLGSYVLVWRDTRTNKTYIVRNTGRSLFILDDLAGSFLASEELMLKWVCGRAKYYGNPTSVLSEELFSIGGEGLVSVAKIPFKTYNTYVAKPVKTNYPVDKSKQISHTTDNKIVTASINLFNFKEYATNISLGRMYGKHNKIPVVISNVIKSYLKGHTAIRIRTSLRRVDNKFLAEFNPKDIKRVFDDPNINTLEHDRLMGLSCCNYCGMDLVQPNFTLADPINVCIDCQSYAHRYEYL